MEKSYHQWLLGTLDYVPFLQQLTKNHFKHKAQQLSSHHYQHQKMSANQANCNLTACAMLSSSLTNNPTFGGDADAKDFPPDTESSSYDDDYWLYMEYGSFNNSFYDYSEADWLDDQLEELYKILRESQKTTNIALTAFLTVIFLVGLTGNTLVLAVFSRTKIKQASTILIMALAANDLIICGIVLPGVLLKEWYVPFRWDAVCRAWEWLRCATIPLSAIILVIVGVDRYVLICRVGEVRAISVRKARCLILLAALVSIGHAVPPMLRVGVYQKESESDTVYLGLCLGNDLLIDQLSIDRYWQAMTAEFVLVLIIVVVMYSLVFRTVYKQNKRWAVGTDQSTLPNSHNRGNPSLNDTSKPVVTASSNKKNATQHYKRRQNNKRPESYGISGLNESSRNSIGQKPFPAVSNGNQSHSGETDRTTVLTASRKTDSEDSDARLTDSLTSLDDGHYNVLNTVSQDEPSVSSGKVTAMLSLPCSGGRMFSKTNDSYKTSANVEEAPACNNNTKIQSPKKIGWVKRQTFRMFKISTAQMAIHKTSNKKLKKRFRAKIKMMNEELTSEKIIHSIGKQCIHGCLHGSTQSGIHTNDRETPVPSNHNKCLIPPTNKNDEGISNLEIKSPQTVNLQKADNDPANICKDENNKTVSATLNLTGKGISRSLPQTNHVQDDKTDIPPNIPITNTKEHPTQINNQGEHNPPSFLKDNFHVPISSEFLTKIEKAKANYRLGDHVDELADVTAVQDCSINKLNNNETDYYPTEAKDLQKESKTGAESNAHDGKETNHSSEYDIISEKMGKQQGHQSPVSSCQLTTKHSLSCTVHTKSQVTHDNTCNGLIVRDMADGDTMSARLQKDVERSDETVSVLSYPTSPYNHPAKTAKASNKALHVRFPLTLRKLCQKKVYPLNQSASSANRVPVQEFDPNSGGIQTGLQESEIPSQTRLPHQPCSHRHFSLLQAASQRNEEPIKESNQQTSGSRAGFQHSTPQSQRQLPQKRCGYSTAQVKTAKVLLLVTAVYIFSFAPVLLMILGAIPSHPIPFYGYFIHSAANPLIYSFINQAFRNQLRQLFTCKCK